MNYEGMVQDTFYLVHTLIERDGEASDCHMLYSTLDKAKAAMRTEVEDAMENFSQGKVVHDLERLYEFRNEDGYGFTVGIDELKLL